MLSRSSPSHVFRLTVVSRQTSAPSHHFVQSCTRIRPVVRPWAQCRAASTDEGFHDLRRRHPFLVAATVTAALVSIGALIYAPSARIKSLEVPQHTFPENVADELRKGIRKDTQAKEPKQALVHFHKALAVAHEAGLDPLSAEILGIKLRIGDLREQFKDYEGAIKVYGSIRSDCAKRVQAASDADFVDGSRRRILGTATRASIKMGELYSESPVPDFEKAEEALTWGVDTILRESKRQEAEGVREGEEPWLSPEECGAAFEILGEFYERRFDFELAAPLFLKALTLCPTGSCHATSLMNHLTFASIAFAMKKSHTPDLYYEPPDRIGSAEWSVERGVANRSYSDALKWARMTVETADAVPPELSSEECERVKCSAHWNIAWILQEVGDIASAIDHYKQAQRLAKKIGYSQIEVDTRRKLTELNA